MSDEQPGASEPSASALKGTPYCQHLGMRYEPRAEVGEGEAPVDVVLPLGPHLTNKRGVVNGGALASMLDAALGCAVLAAMKPEEWCATVSLDVQFIRPGRGADAAAGDAAGGGGDAALAVREVVEDPAPLGRRVAGRGWRSHHRRPG